MTRSKKFQSTHPVRGATLRRTDVEQHRKISIHAPREGCDGWTTCLITRAVISIHAPREGCDTIGGAVSLPVAKFQSTHPVRGATPVNVVTQVFLVISIHAPREGCDFRDSRFLAPFCLISIHAPREGCDVRRLPVRSGRARFQSTHPVRGATCGLRRRCG